MLPIYAAGCQQAWQLQKLDEAGYLKFPVFIDTVDAILPFWWLRVAGGALYVSGVAMLALNENRQVRMTDCSITIDNPSRRDEIHAINIVTDPESTVLGASAAPRTTGGVADAMPLVSIELYNVIIRGQN